MRILFLFLAVVLAWSYADEVIKGFLFSLPLIGEFLKWLFPNSGDVSFFYYIKAAAITFVLYYVLKGSKGVFSFLLPVTQSYAATKPVRYLHALMGEVVFVWSFFVLAAIPLTFYMAFGEPSNAQRDIYDTINKVSGEASKRQNTPYCKDPRREYEDIQDYLNRLTLCRQPVVNQDWVRKYPFRTYFFTVIGFGLPFWIPGMILSFVAGRDFKKGVSEGYTEMVRFLQAGRMGRGGSARFTNLFEEWGLRTFTILGDRQLQRDEIFLGKSLYSPFLNVAIKDNRHMLTIAGSRAGKGASCIIPNLIEWRGNVIVLDPKGTNAIVTAKRRGVFMKQKVYIMDPFEITKGKIMIEPELTGGGCIKRVSYNPLANFDINHINARDRISIIAEAIAPGSKDPRSEHWDEGAQTLIAGLITHLLTTKENPNLCDIRDYLFLSRKEQNALWVDMLENDKAGGLARDAAARVISSIETDEIKNIMSNVHKHTKFLSSPAIRSVLAGNEKQWFYHNDNQKSGPVGQSKLLGLVNRGVILPETLVWREGMKEWVPYRSITLETESEPINLRELRDDHVTLYVVLPPPLLEQYGRFMRLLVNMAMCTLTFEGKAKRQTLFMMDEFLSLGHMKEVEKAFTFMAGYNMVMWPFVQDYGTLQELYGRSVGAFVSNSRAVQVFGVSDTDTLKFVSDKIGMRSLSLNRSIDNSSYPTPFRTPSEVELEIERDSKQQYILRAGKPTMLLERANYYKKYRDQGESGCIGLMNFEWAMRGIYPFLGKWDKDPDY